MFQDTIAAISTADMMGAVSIIRISGEEAFSTIEKLCHKDLSKYEGYTMHNACIYEDDEIVDRVLVSVFHGPKSYTGEDVIEINCHGGVYITHKVLQLVLGNEGVRLARNGEFSERAFLHGKMDLSQAEGINDLIWAKDETNARSAVHALNGSVLKLMKPLEEELTQIIANIEVNIDYPEYDDVHQLCEEEIYPSCQKWLETLNTIIKTSQSSLTIKEGIKTVILGKPNVGKSSLLNALLEEDKAIVTNIAGTTRDLVEGQVRVGNLTLHMIDTAGIHEANDTVEQIGIQKSIDALNKAQLVILVLDASREIDAEDQKLIDLTQNKNRIIVKNKNDLQKPDNELSISALNGDIEPLKEKILSMFEEGLIAVKQDTLNNERQIGLAIQARNSMQNAIYAIENGDELDLITIDLQNAWHALREITGKASKEDLLDEIFSRFCLGK